jgi:hypothetical protein
MLKIRNVLPIWRAKCYQGLGHQLFIKLQAMRHSLNKGAIRVGDTLSVVGQWSLVS